MNRCTYYFVSFYNISTRFSHIYMKNGEFDSSGNDYLPLHCWLPHAVKVTWYICLAIKTNISVAPNLLLYIKFSIKADISMHLQKTAIFYKIRRALWYAEHGFHHSIHILNALLNYKLHRHQHRITNVLYICTCKMMYQMK